MEESGEKVFNCGCGDGTAGVLHHPACPLVAQAAPVPHPPRRACKAWCGGSRAATLGNPRQAGDGWGANGDTIWCTAACRDARLPRLADAPEQEAPAQVWYLANAVCGLILTSSASQEWADKFRSNHEEKCPKCKTDQPKAAAIPTVACPTCKLATTRIGGYCSRECEKQPKVAAKALPVCAIRAPGGCNGPLLMRRVGAVGGLMCESCMLSLEAKVSNWTGGTPSNAPPKPEPMAVVEWLDDLFGEDL